MAHLNNGAVAVATSDRPPLDRISDYADDLERIAGYISDFLARCRGCEAANDKLAPVPSGHIGQLDRLADELHRVDCLAHELQTIG
jgi:hypothetical protein